MPPDETPELSLVIPCYREGEKILHDLKAATEFLDQEKIHGEVIVVDDGSPDSTAARAQEFARRDSRIEVVRYEPNRGKGHALRIGMARTRGRLVMFADAGLCVPYRCALDGIKLVREGKCDMAIGSRVLAQSLIVRHSPLYRRVASKIFWIILRLFMGIPQGIRDTQCGFKVYDGAKARKLFDGCFVDGMMTDIELICKAARGGWKIESFPVEWRNDSDTRLNPIIHSWGFLRDLIKIRLRY